MRYAETAVLWMLCLTALLAHPAAASERQAEESTKQSKFTNAWGAFELRLTAGPVVADGAGAASLVRCRYRVFRNGRRLPLDRPGTDTLLGCHLVPPDRIQLRTIGTGEHAVGWLIGVGGICGNTFSWKWTVIRPEGHGDAWRVDARSFLAKLEPVVREKADAFELWSQYQEWGRTGTALSFFVPERRRILRNPGRTYGIIRAELPTDIATWPDLKWRSPVGVLVAGITQLNPGLIESAAGSIGDEDRKVLRAQGLPATTDGLRTLAAEIRRTRVLAERLGHLRLDWSEHPAPADDEKK